MTSQGPVERLNAALEGRYHLERQVGEGGMATVYLATDLRHKRKVALKVQRFMMARVVQRETDDLDAQPGYVLVQNFVEELKARVPR